MTFHFDAAAHVYTDAHGRELPHITGLLVKAGLIDDTFYTEESCDRGVEVHRLTARYELDDLDPATCVSAYKGYLQAYVEAMAVLQRPEWSHVEVAMAHDQLRFAGRADRVGAVRSLLSVLEVKSGAPHPVHMVQTALQAILAAQEHAVPAEAFGRFALYVRWDGRFRLFRHDNQQDFRVARDLVQRFR